MIPLANDEASVTAVISSLRYVVASSPDVALY
jgi:hypothetical protein